MKDLLPYESLQLAICWRTRVARIEVSPCLQHPPPTFLRQPVLDDQMVALKMNARFKFASCLLKFIASRLKFSSFEAGGRHGTAPPRPPLEKHFFFTTFC
jgi:hypothetical protein